LNEESEEEDMGRDEDPGVENNSPPTEPPKVTPVQNLPQASPPHANPIAYITNYVYWATSFLF
jgi:hypothetical protein